MQGNYLEQALGMIHSRRLAAEQQNRERIMEIESRIPEVSEVNYQMFRTSRDLMQIIVKGENTKERVAALRQQNLQAQEMIRRLLKEHGYPEDYLELHYTCEKCNDTGYFQQKYCTCLTDLIAKLSARELNKSVQFEQCSFENFDLNYYRGFQTENGGSCYQAMEGLLLLSGIRPPVHQPLQQHSDVREDRPWKNPPLSRHCQSGAAKRIQCSL